MISLPRRIARLAVAAALIGVLTPACDVHSVTDDSGTPALVSLEVTPDVTMGTGETQQFVAVGKDAEGADVTISPTWSVVADGGTIDNEGMFTAGDVAGTYDNTIRAASGSIEGFASVIVTEPAPDLASIEVTPDVTMGSGETQRFVAVGRDTEGTVVKISPTWSVVAGGGTIDNEAMFTAGEVAGTYDNTIRAASGSIEGFASVIVTEQPPAEPLVDLGAAETHGILAGSTITCVDLGTIYADASVWPGSAITGFPPCEITEEQHAADAYAETAQGALTSAYNELDGMPCDATLTTDLGGMTLEPGVYCSTSSQGLTGEMFLDALGDSNASFVIKAASTLTTANARVTLLNGAQARNIYWLVGSSATLGTSSAMKGNIITLQDMTLNDNASLLGRALARNGAVSLGTNNVITLP